MPVETPCAEYEANIAKWTRCRDAADGGDAVKARGMAYLPALASHATAESSGYKAYVLRALFYNATGRTIEGLSGSIFQKPPVLETPSSIEDHMKDVTLTGESAETFSLKSTREVLGEGRYGILVDMPPVVPGAPAGDQRPYWTAFRAEEIVNWDSARVAGEQLLTLVVLKESYTVIDEKDPFRRSPEAQYRVLELIGYESPAPFYAVTLWRKPPKKLEFEVFDRFIPMRKQAPLTYIPFVFLGPTSTSPTVEKPPLLDLVDVNLSHYRTSADLEHGRHFTALPTPWVSGQAADDEGDLSIGSEVVWVLEKDGKAGMLEFTGDGLGTLVTADQEKRRMMATLGAKLLEEQSSTQETADAVGMRHSGEHATLKTVAQVIEQGLTQVLKWHAWWVGTDADPEDVEASFELNKEMFSVKAKPEEVKTALLALQAGEMSYETFWFILTKGGWTREGVSAEEEKEQIRSEQKIEEELNPTPVFGMEGGAFSIEERDGQFVVLNVQGKVLATAATEEEANAKMEALRTEKPKDEGAFGKKKKKRPEDDDEGGEE